MKEDSVGNNYRVVSVLISSVLLLTLFAGALPLVMAHSPSSMTLSYDFSQQNLSVTISHSVSNPGTHYVDTVTIYRNSAVVNTYTYSSQPTSNTFTYHYSVTASDGDTLAAKADCNIGGSIQRSTTASAPDTTPPTITITSPANASKVGEQTITVSGTSSDDDELSKVQVRVGEGTWTDASGTESWSLVVSLAEGNNTIEAKAIDASDNEATASIVVEYIPEAQDETPPSITINSPNDGSVLTVPSVTVSGTASDNVDVEKVEVRINGGTWSDSSGTNSWTYDAALSLGNNTIEARATDPSGNTNNDSITVEYDPDAGQDREAPVITIQQPSDGLTVTTSSLTVSGTASDDVGLDVVEVRVNNGNWNTASGTISWSLAVSLREGSNSIEVRAFDLSGNMGDDTVTVTYEPEKVDTTPPAVTIQSPDDQAQLTEANITVSGIASDNQCLCRVEWRINEGNWVMATGRTTWSFQTTLEPGLNFIDVRVFDDSGNTGSTSISVTFDHTEPKDTTSPELTITSPSDGSTVNTERITVSGTASDNEDLDMVEIRLNGGSLRTASGLSSWSLELTLMEGANTIEVTAVDTSDNSRTVTITVTYEIPYTPGALDGVIGDSEYRWSAEFDDGNFIMYWDIEGELLKLGMMARAEGWISIGIAPTVLMKDADMIIGWVDDGKVFVFDAFSTGEYGPHPPDTELGGTDDIIDFGGSQSQGWTTIEITRNVNSTDLYDRNFRSVEKLDIIWAYSNADDFNSAHPSRGSGDIEVIPSSEEKPVDETDDEDEDGSSIIWFIVIILIVVFIIGAAAAYFIIQKKKTPEEEEEEEFNPPSTRL